MTRPGYHLVTLRAPDRSAGILTRDPARAAAWAARFRARLPREAPPVRSLDDYRARPALHLHSPRPERGGGKEPCREAE